MTRRLQVTYLALLTVVLASLVVPLAATVAAQRSTAVFLDRQADTLRFASLADSALVAGRAAPLARELTDYQSLYGVHAAVFDRDGSAYLRSGDDGDLTSPRVEAAVRRVLEGGVPSYPRTVWPWDPDPLLVTEPVVSDGQVVGATATLSPTGALRAELLRRFLGLGALSALVLVVGVLAGRPLSRRLSRPVDDLVAATQAISAGRMDARVEASGPPELVDLASSFNLMVDRVNELLRQQQMVVAYAGHQLRNPLTAIRIRLEDFGDRLAPGDPDCDELLAEVDRLGEICGSLMALSRAGEPGVQRTLVPAHEVARQRARAWTALADRRGVSLACEVDEVWGLAAPSTLDQVLDALLDNAIKYSPTGGDVQVTVGTDEAGPRVQVLDAGPGLPDPLLRRATTPFWRRGDEGVAGHGLGLAIAVALLERSGGSLDLGPGPAGGMRATVRLEEGVLCP